MSNGHDRLENEGNSGGSFVIGLLAGTVLGAGLGMLFAPKSGSDLRGQLSDQAGNLATSAQDKVRRAADGASVWAGKGIDKGREIVDKGREVVDKGRDMADKGRDWYDTQRDTLVRAADQAQDVVRDAADAIQSKARG